MNATLPSTRPAIITSILSFYSQVHDTNAGIASQPRTVEVDDGWRPPPHRIVPNAPDSGVSTTQPLAFTCLRYEVLRPPYVVNFETDLVCSRCKALSTNMSHKQWHDWVSPDVPYVILCPGVPLHPTDRTAFQGVCAPGSFSRGTHPNTAAGCGPTRPRLENAERSSSHVLALGVYSSLSGPQRISK